MITMLEGRRRVQALVLTLGVSAALAGCGDREETRSPSTQAEERPAPNPREIFTALPERVDVNRDKMLLGRRLFHDPILSGDRTVSCATCHSLDHGGAEPRRTSTGIGSQVGPINSPTVLNAEYNFRQFWDGRAADLLEQAAGPVSNPIEMGGDWDELVERIREDEHYGPRFVAVYGESGVTQANVLDAIVEYERSLVTPSRFDTFLRGDDDALTEQERRGLTRFMEVGCTACHSGRNVGGTTFERMGLVQNYFEQRGGEITEADLGRFNVTGDEADRHKFKVPTLRNIALTSPYFHDGTEDSLAGAVRTMGRVQLGQDLSDEDVRDIVAFMNSLTGELPADARLPESEQPAGAAAAAAESPDADDVTEAHGEDSPDQEPAEASDQEPTSAEPSRGATRPSP